MRERAETARERAIRELLADCAAALGRRSSAKLLAGLPDGAGASRETSRPAEPMS